MAKAKRRSRVLTDLWIEALPVPRHPREYSDAIARGLTIRVSVRGRKTWCFVWRVRGEGEPSPITGKPMSGQQRRMTIGPYPDVGLAEARERARVLMSAVSEGKDPRDATATDKSFGALARAFLIAKESTVRPNSAAAMRNALERHVLPKWAEKPHESLDRQSLNQLTDELTKAVGKATGDAARKWSKSVFTWALDAGLIKAHALAGVARPRRDQTEQAGRVLSDSDIRAVWLASHDLPILRLLILTGCRRSEWSGASWSEINADERTLVIPAKRYKTGVTFELPLVPSAWQIVESLTRYDDLIFSGVDPVDSALDKVRARTPQVEHWSPHDLRRTLVTGMTRLGVAKEIRDAVIGHFKRSDERPYNRHDFAAEKRAALELYAKHVTGGA